MRGRRLNVDNLAMKRKLDRGECLDVNVEGIRIGTVGPSDLIDGTWHLREFQDNVDYCDAEGERWIWSIGKSMETGRIYASLDSRFYQCDGFECLFLR